MLNFALLTSFRYFPAKAVFAECPLDYLPSKEPKWITCIGCHTGGMCWQPISSVKTPLEVNSTVRLPIHRFLRRWIPHSGSPSQAQPSYVTECTTQTYLVVICVSTLKYKTFVDTNIHTEIQSGANKRATGQL